MEKEQNKILKRILLAGKELGKFLKLFAFLFLIMIIIINWGTIKGMFDYKAVYGEMLSSLKAEIDNKKEMVLRVPQVKLNKPESEFEYTDKPDSIEIPKFELVAPLLISETTIDNDLQELLKKGVVFYPDSVLPGKEGVTVILGHSAPSGWSKINYDWVFTRLNELRSGDEIFIYLNNRKYHYLVIEKLFLKKGDEIPESDISGAASILTLLSCWPPGIDYKRIAVQAELQL